LFHIIFNAFWKALTFELPPTAEQGLTPWRRVIDTARESPDDFCDPEAAPVVEASTLGVSARSVVVLVAQNAAL
jgi:glycogen operon protein